MNQNTAEPFEQIGICVPNPDKAMELLGTLGVGVWTHDEVSAVGEVGLRWGANRADLHFNYQLLSGVEFEYLNYMDGPNWHERVFDDLSGDASFTSHIARHVDDLQPWIDWAEQQGLDIVQHVRTAHHTNDHIKDSRRYEYLIISTRHVLGFDIKLIKRWYISDRGF